MAAIYKNSRSYGGGGGSGSGGHTILDKDAVELTQEESLQFKTMQVTDENGITVVRQVVQMSLAEYNALPSSKLTDGVIYEITDSNSGQIQADNVGYGEATVKSAIDTNASGISGLDTRLTTEEAKKGTILTGTLSALSWSSNSQTATCTGMTTSIDGVVGVLNTASAAQRSAWYSCGICATAQGANTVTFTCVTVPTVDIPFGVFVYK